MTVPLLVLGAGWLGRRVLSSVPHSVGTTRSGVVGTLRFTFGEGVSSLPSAHAVLWTFPVTDTAAGLALMDAFPNAHHILLGTTGALTEDRGAWVDESSVVDASPRTQSESALVARGAQLLRLAGLWGEGRWPWAWLTAGRIADGSKHVNLVHQDDALAAVLNAVAHPQRGTLTHVTDGLALHWSQWAEALSASGRLPAAFAFPARAAAVPSGKRIHNARLRSALGAHVFTTPAPWAPPGFTDACTHLRTCVDALGALAAFPAEDWVLQHGLQERATHAVEQAFESLLELDGHLAAHLGASAALSVGELPARWRQWGLLTDGQQVTLAAAVRIRRSGAEGYTGVAVETLHQHALGLHSVMAGVQPAVAGFFGRPPQRDVPPPR